MRHRTNATGFPAAQITMPDAVPGILGEIVERSYVSSGSSGGGQLGPGPLPPPSLRPIQATVGRGFPRFDPNKSYGLRANPPSNPSVAATTAAAGATTTATSEGRRVTFSAHVQPEEPNGPNSSISNISGCGGGGSCAGDSLFTAMARQLAGTATSTATGTPTDSSGCSGGFFPVGGSAGSRAAIAHQWTPSDFRGLYEGYYDRPLPAHIVAAHAPPPASTTAAAATDLSSGITPLPPPPPPPPPPVGEDFFNAVFKCLRSTVRTHQGIALDALCLHLRYCGGKDGTDKTDDTTTASKMINSHKSGGANALRDRCLHGPDCAPFLYFIMDVMGSAKHPFLCRQAAACLALLLVKDGAGGEGAVAAVVGEVGSPPSDAPTTTTTTEEEEERDARHRHRHRRQEQHEGEEGPGPNGSKDKGTVGGGHRPLDDADLPFSEISELLRADGEVRAGLEKMGFTNHVMAAMHTLLLLPSSSSSSSSSPGEEDVGTHGGGNDDDSGDVLLTLWLSLLRCGGIGESAAVSNRIAQDPLFLSRVVEPQLSHVVLGDATPTTNGKNSTSGSANGVAFSSPLDSPALVQLLLVLYRLAHIPSALRHLLYGGGSGPNSSTSGSSLYELWTLYFISVCTTSTTSDEVHSMNAVAVIVLSLLVLREMARNGHQGLLSDLCDTLMAEGLACGSGVVLEMWVLLLQQQEQQNSPSVRGRGAVAVDERTKKRDDDSTNSSGSVARLLRDAARAALAQLSAESTHCGGGSGHDGGDDECGGVSEGVSNSKSMTSSGGGGGVVVEEAGTETATATATAASMEAQSALRAFAATASRHYLATYLTAHHQSDGTSDGSDSLTLLLGSSVETQAAMQTVLVTRVLRPSMLATAFGRLTCPTLHTPSSSSLANGLPLSEATAAAIAAVLNPRRHNSSSSSDAATCAAAAAAGVEEAQQWRLAVRAALLHATLRLSAAISATFPAVDIIMNSNSSAAFAAAVTVKFQLACLFVSGGSGGGGGVQRRLQTDELCTVVEALGILQRAERAQRTIASTNRDSSSSSFYVSYRREVRVAAVFLAHGIAITKQCLDAAPRAIACMLDLDTEELERRRETSTDVAEGGGVLTAAAERTALALGLLAGVELTPIPEAGATALTAVLATGSPRSWVLHPLFAATSRDSHHDNHDHINFPCTALWAEWLRQVLGLHNSMRDVLGWDGIFSHTLLWVLAHRRELFSATTMTATTVSEEEETTDDDDEGEYDEFSFDAVVTARSGKALCELLSSLAVLLLPSSSSSSSLQSADTDTTAAVFSLNAARVLSVSLSDYTDPKSEEAAPSALFLTLMLLAARCEPTAALAIVHLLLCTPVLSVAPSTSSTTSVLDSSSASNSNSTNTTTNNTAGGGEASRLLSLTSLCASSSSTYRVAAEVLAWGNNSNSCRGSGGGITQQITPTPPTPSTAQVSRKHAVWCLERVVSLLQLTGPYLAQQDHYHGALGSLIAPATLADDATATSSSSSSPLLSFEAVDALRPELFHRWCLHALTVATVDQFIASNSNSNSSSSGPVLSTMQRAVLRGTLEDIGLRLEPLWSLVHESENTIAQTLD